MLVVGQSTSLKTEAWMSKWRTWSEEEEETLEQMTKAKRLWKTRQEALRCFAKVLTERTISGIDVKVRVLRLEIKLAKQQINQDELDAFFKLTEEM